MAQPKSTPFAKRRSRRRLLAVLGALVVLAVAGFGISRTNGTPKQEISISDPSVWAVRSGATSYYGEVNTAISELSSVHTGNATSFPISGVLQHEGSVVLYSAQNILPLNTARPADIESSEILPAKPLGADQVVASGPWALFLNRASGLLGAVEIANLAKGDEVTHINIEAEEGDDGEQFAAATITDTGLVYAVTKAGDVLTHEMSDGTRNSLASGVDIPDNAVSTEMTVFDDTHWALLVRLENSSQLWIDGAQAPFTVTGTARLAEPATSAASLALADQAGLHFLNTSGEETSSVVSNSVAGAIPAAPLWRGTCTHSAWSNGSAMFASTCTGDIAQLAFPEGAAGTNGDPSFRASGQDVILNDAGNGLIWQLKGRTFELVASSAEWRRDFEQMNTNEAKQNQDAKQNECPVPASGSMAEFGVRAGQATSIPVLVAAQDPNPGDTISIVPSEGSPGWTGDGIGELTLSTNSQSVALVPQEMTGSASFNYTITDGQSDCSVAATATVSVHPDDVRSAPEYRAAQNDSLNHMQVSPGGSLRFDGLAGWVDPDGDPLYISSVTASAGTAAFTPQGVVAYRADDDQEPGQVTLTVNVADGHGDGISSHNYTVLVSDAPTLYARSFSRSVPAGTTATIDLSEQISGISLGDVRTARAEITSATVENETLRSKIQIQTNSDEMSVTVTPTDEGIYPISYSVESGTSQATGTILVNAHKTNIKLSSPALTAFVRPGEDVTIDPLNVVTNPAGTLLMVRDIQTVPVTDGGLTAAAIGGSQLRIAGHTPTDEAGRVGTVTYTVTDGEASAPGQVAVFELDEAASTKPVTVPDQVTVRAGEQIDIPVLANDIAAGGTTLTLDASRTTDDETGLAFASDKVLRYLAPSEPGYYTLFYRAYAVGHSDAMTDGRVIVHVTASGENRAPTAKPLEARVEAGSSTMIDVSTFGVDPDGDDTFVASVTQPSVNGSVQLMPDGRIQVTSTSGESPIEFEYTIKDSRGSSATAKARVGVLKDTSRTPVAYNDYVEVTPGTSTVTLDPTLNDRAIGSDKLVVEKISLQPSGLATDTEGTADEPKAQVGENNLVTLEAPQTVGKLVYRYTVASVDENAKPTAKKAEDTEEEGSEDSESAGAKAEGIIVVSVTEQAVPTYPIVRDTLVGTNDIRGETFTADVLTDKAVWSNGELRTALKSDLTGVTLRGANLSGSLSERRQTIPFSATGTADGQELTTWAFVKVPQLENILPELAGNNTYEVKQGESVTIDLNDEIKPFGDRRLQVTSTSTSGSRSDASCSASGTKVTYSAGDAAIGETDACHIGVQWAGYDRSATQLSIPVKVIIDNAPPTLTGQQIAVVDPGQSATYNLLNAVTWEGKDTSQLRFECDPATGAQGVSVECSGSTVTMKAEDTAQQGATSTFNVRITSPNFGVNQPSARMSVQVGTLAPLTLNPSGASLTINASSSNSATTDDLVALNNGIRHYGNLQLVAGSASFPTGFTGTINGNRVTVTAQDGAPGGTASGSVRIEDAQGNSGSVPIEVTYNARPNPPQVVVSSVGDGVVNLMVRDNATASVPAVTGYTVTWSGAGGSGSKSCSEGACQITGLRNYQEISISATSENSQGSSDPTNAGTTYAYASPASPTIAFVQPLANGEGLVSITPGDSSDNQIAVYVGGYGDRFRQHIVTSAQNVTIGSLPNGKARAVEVVAEAIASIGPPPTLNQTFSQSARSNTVTAYSIGAPSFGELSAGTKGSNITATVTNIATGGDGLEWQWIVNGKGYGSIQTAGGTHSVEIPASALKRNQVNEIKVEAHSTYNGQRVAGASQSVGPATIRPVTFPTDAGDVTFSFDNEAADSSFALHNTQRKDGDITFKAELVEKPNSSRCTAKIRWTYTENGHTYSDSARHEAGPEPGSPCYAVYVDHSELSDFSMGGNDTRWDPTISGLPPVAEDYDIKVEWSRDGNHWTQMQQVPQGTGTIQFTRADYWIADGHPYYVRLTIDFKNNLEGITTIGKSITIYP